MKRLKKFNFFIRYISKFCCINDNTAEPPPEIIRILWVLVSTFACTIMVEATFKYAPVFINRDVPIIIPSWVASMILTCNTLESPFGQPYNLVVGTFICSLLGVILTKLWLLIPSNVDSLWVCGALAASLASVLMSYVQVVHPAACAAAIIPVTDESVRKLGWYYLVVQLVSAVLVIIGSALFANIYAQYPTYWLLPPKLEDDAVNFEDNDSKREAVIWRTQNREPAEPDMNTDTSVSPLHVRSEDENTTNSNDRTENDDILEEGPAPVPYTEDDIEIQPPSARSPDTNTASLGYSLSREPTQEDDEVVNPARVGATRTRRQSLQQQGIETLNSLKVSPTRASLTRVATKTNYLQRIKTSTASKMRMAALFPNVDLNRTVIISATDYTIPSTVNFSMLDKGVLFSIQKKLYRLELMAQSKRRLSRAASLPVSFNRTGHDHNNQTSNTNGMS